MKGTERGLLAKAGFLLLSLIVVPLLSGCVVATPGYHEGYYDRDHHRWYHEHGWVDCGDHDVHCH